MVVIFVSCLAFAQEILPSGWRKPSHAETSDDWRKKSPTRFQLIKADFDGDRKSDVAELLVNPSDKQFAFFVKLGSTEKWQMIGKPYDLTSLGRFGIDVIKPGKYETACGKGYGDYACAHGEPDYLKLSNSAIDVFYTESSDSIFYWDATSKEFREILMSD